jgi:hypothetical protein
MSTDTLSVQVETLTYQRDEWRDRANMALTKAEALKAAGDTLACTLRAEHAECVDDLVPCPALRALAAWREAVTG